MKKISGHEGMDTCSICGKIFVCSPMSIYKTVENNRVKHQCSYTCWRKAGGDNGKKCKR